MDILKKLENIKPNKPYRGFAKLSVGYHEILLFRIVKNKYGKKNDVSAKTILIELADEVLFLPQHFLKFFNEDGIERLNAAIENGEPVYVYFGGKEKESK